MIQATSVFLWLIYSFTLIGVISISLMIAILLLKIINEIAKIKINSKTHKWLFIILIIIFALFISIKYSLLLIVGYLNAMAYYEAKKKEGSK